MDEGSLLLTWFIYSVFFLQIFIAVLCRYFLDDFFSPPPTISIRSCTFLASLVSLESLFHGSATLTLKLFLLTSALAYLWTRFSGSAACLVLVCVPPL
jgi:hypothetical protein